MKKITKKKLRKRVGQHKLVLVTAAVAVALVGGAVYALLGQPEPAGEKHMVTFYDQGVKRIVLTRAGTVKEALAAADIRVDPHDTLDPSGNTKLSERYVDVIIYRSRLIAVQDGHVRQNVLTTAQSPNAILRDAKLEPLDSKDKAQFIKGDLVANGTITALKIERAKPSSKVAPAPRAIVFKPKANALTASKGAQVYVDSEGVAHRETYYDLPMNIVIGTCGVGSTYSIRSDGAKIDQDGYVLVAANLRSYPRCSVVDTSLGPGKVYDTGGFAVRHPYGFDLATDWTNYDGR